MEELKSNYFYSNKDLVDFVNYTRVKIVAITQEGKRFTLFYKIILK